MKCILFAHNIWLTSFHAGSFTKLWGCRSCMVAYCGQLYGYNWLTWRVLCIRTEINCVPFTVVSWTSWVLVGHGTSDVIVVGVRMVGLFLVTMACAQKLSRYVSTFNSQIVAFVLQSAWIEIMTYFEYMYCTYRSVLGKRPLPGKCPGACFGCLNGQRPLPGKCPGC